MRRIALLLWLAFATALPAQEATLATQARDALEMLDAAADALEAAEKRKDRVRALTETVAAYETGLAALREGLRAATLREDRLRRQLSVQDAETAGLLSALLAIPPETSPEVFLHPQSVVGAARAGMLLAEVFPALNARADALRTTLNDVQDIRALQETAALRLQDGLRDIQTARLALSQAISERTDLPRRFIEDPEMRTNLLAVSQTLTDFASGVGSLAGPESDWRPPPLGDRIGALTLPVRGTILRYPGEADAAGITRPGLVMATRPGALVTAPAAATIRYAGPLLDLGQVVILEPRADVMFIFAGLAVIYGESGQIIEESTPLGLMGGLQPELTANPTSTGGESAGTGRSETLYIEVRQGNVPQDPTAWFRTEKDG